MVEIEHIPKDLLIGATVTKLCDIQSRSVCHLSWDIPEEYAFFIEEGFATFDCNDKFSNDSCNFCLMSQVPWTEKGAWAIFGTYNLEVARGQSHLRYSSAIACVLQELTIELPRKSELGYLQMICLADKVITCGQQFDRHDLLTLYVYRNRKVREAVPRPNVITIRPQTCQTYVPMVPGQHLQLIVEDSTQIDVTDDCLTHLTKMDKLFVLGEKRFNSQTYVCCKKDERVDTVFIKTVDEKTNFRSVLVPSLKKTDHGIYTTIFPPVAEALVYSEGIDGLDIVCPEGQTWVWDEDCMMLTRTEEGVSIHLKKPMKNIIIQKDTGCWWVC